MKCDDIFELILDGRPLTEEMQDHADRCDYCTQLIKTVCGVGDLGKNERKRDLSPATVNRTLFEAARVTEERLSPPHMKMKEWWLVQRLTAAAAIVLAVGLAIIIAQRLISPPDQKPPVVAHAMDLNVGAGTDILREEVDRELSGFMGRHYASSDTGRVQEEFAMLRTRMNLASVGLEKELSGL